MSSPAIIVENLSKKFRIGTGGGPGYHRLSEAAAGIPRALYNSARNLFPDSSPRPETGRGAGGEEPVSTLNPQPSTLNSSPDFWALRDVSFEVQPGEVVGIIGRNGAGKSTLLKILSRITEPTSGRFGVRGRVASLLEVGTGFHPELTGRENIYVSGVTLGMTRAEIKKRFDEIVEFSGVEKFLDTPVKHYSSGMQVRLGFAVAAHLESEILIVDEVLAVGDAAFQQRCLGKIDRIAGSGRTIMLVSHSMSVVGNHCQRAILLDFGVKQYDGDSQQAVSAYLLNGAGCLQQWKNTDERPGNEHARLIAAGLMNEEGKFLPTVRRGQCAYMYTHYEILSDAYPIVPNLVVSNEHGTVIFTTCDDVNPRSIGRIPGQYRSKVALPTELLPSGTYSVSVFLSTFTPKIKHVAERSLISFAVADCLEDNRSRNGNFPGVIQPKLAWTTEPACDHEASTVAPTD